MDPSRSESANTGMQNGEMKLEKNAGLIMGTNNSSIVSKRSVERLYLPQPHFYRYFVRKPQRRAPTINRGYWLRMKAIDFTVRQFLERSSEKQKVVVNLGCGYDPLPFQWLATERQLCGQVKFIDVDFEELMISKRDIILATPQMNDLLTSCKSMPSDRSLLLDSTEYAALGCDLRNIHRLDGLIRSVAQIENCIVLFVAEVSITYMHSDAADAVIAWAAGLAPDTTFCLLEQSSPDRPDNPFTATMLRHFEKLGTPLRSVLKYPGHHTQMARFFAAGFANVDSQNLWEFWANPKYMSPSQRLALDQIEPFDEWEDFALFASHYCLVVAHNGPLLPEDMKPAAKSRRDSCASIGSELSTRTVSPIRHGTQWFAYRYCENPEGEGRTHHASAYPMLGGKLLAVHGGIGPHARLGTTSVYAPSHDRVEPPVVPPLKLIAARCCHTVTALDNGQNILIGGRSSPNHPMKDCWIQSGSSWERIDDLPAPRYRHRSAAVTLPDDDYGVVVFGGKDGPSNVHVDHLLWSPRLGWQKLQSLKQDPVPRFGCSFITLGNNHGIMFGGMRQDGVICQGFWRWRLVIRDCTVAGISFRESTALDVSVGTYPWLARIGASFSIIRNEILVIGGVAKLGCIPKSYEILSVSGSFSAIGEHEHEMDLRLACVEPILAPDRPRPFLIGHSTHRTRTDQTLIMGGGATCFSFGSYYNKGVWLLHDREAGLSTDWSLVRTRSGAESPRYSSADTEIRTEKKISQAKLARRARDLDSRALEAVIKASTPVVIESLDLGDCLQTWDTGYLKSKIPCDRQVVVHRAKSRTMNFQRKDFMYAKTPFHTFLDAALAGHHVYLRALSSSAPTQAPADFETDFPELAQDFQVPVAFGLIKDPARFHSSPLRISSNVNMWLHYDVMANVLFQIRGTKQLLLFPPKDIKRLDFPPGATTSRLDVFTGIATEAVCINAPPGTLPILATLEPGDALFIPPLWAHAGAAMSPRRYSGTPFPENQEARNGESNLNISINTFFRTVNPEKYAAGRDVYGNRDLAAYEDGRRDVQRIVQRFLKGSKSARRQDESEKENDDDQRPPEGGRRNTDLAFDMAIPKDMAKAYLERLAAELMQRANEL